MSRIIRIDLQYEGTNYIGWQSQAHGLSIQNVVESAIERILSQKISVQASGRTDAGVHARQQVCAFEVDDEAPPLDAFHHGLNSILPKDVRVIRALEAPAGFSPRKNALGKSYRYFLQVGADELVFMRNYAWSLRGPLDLNAMRDGAKLLVGKHDFKGFMGPRTSVQTTDREIYEAAFTTEALHLLCFRISANGFLRHMVRIIVGTLIEIGQGKRKPESVDDILKSGDRQIAGQTAPPQGLFLWSVDYNN